MMLLGSNLVAFVLVLSWMIYKHRNMALPTLTECNNHPSTFVPGCDERHSFASIFTVMTSSESDNGGDLCNVRGVYCTDDGLHITKLSAFFILYDILTLFTAAK